MNKKKNAMPVSTAKTAYGLLSEVRKLILAEPKRYDQGDWLARRADNDTPLSGKYPSCGTVGCVAGWVATLRGPKYFIPGDADWLASDILGLDMFMSDELFAGSAADGDGQTPQHARSGAQHISRFQKKYAKQLKAKRLA